MRNFQCKLVRLNDLCDAGKSSLALTSFIKGLALIFQFEKKQKRGMHLSILSCVCGRINNKRWGKKVTSHNFGLGSVTKKSPDKIVYYDVWCPEEVENIWAHLQTQHLIFSEIILIFEVWRMIIIFSIVNI